MNRTSDTVRVRISPNSQSFLPGAAILGLLIVLAVPSIPLYAQPTDSPSASSTATAPPGVPAPLTALTGAHIGRYVTVVGRITNKIAPATTGRAPYKWYVTDGKGVALVVLFPDDYAQIPSPDTRFPAGGTLQVRGKLSEFRGQLQLSPTSPADVQIPAPASPQGVWGLGGEVNLQAPRPSDAAAAPAVPKTSSAAPPASAPALPAEPPEGFVYPGQVTRDSLDTTVHVAGQIAKFRASWSETAPNIITLEGAGGSLDVVFWKDMADALGERKAAITRVGAFLKIEGTLKEYRNRLQLRLEDVAKVSLWELAPPAEPSAASPPVGEKDAAAPAAAPSEAAAPAPEKSESKPAAAPVSAPAPDSAVSSPASPADKPPAAPAGVETRSPSQLGKSDAGKEFIVRGTVRAVRAPTTDRAPTRVELADDTASITVVFWADLADQFAGDNAPREGKPWAVLGKVSEYRGELQLRAQAPAK